MTKDKNTSHNFTKLFDSINHIIEEARNSVYRTANFTMVKAYWNIGAVIVEEEQKGENRAEYGKELLYKLANKLSKEHGKGFTETNLKYMRQFYQFFVNSHALRDELSWTHYRLLLKVKDDHARQFYMQESIACNWSTRTLERQIGNLYYKRMLMSKNPQIVKEESNKKQINQSPKDIIKDPYVLEFLGLKDNTDFRETEFEQAIIDKLQEFLLELGKGFAFFGRQYRLTTEKGKHFYADLVFYNFILKCFLIIELKTKPLSHEDIGQMDLYVNYFEDKIKQNTDNPTIGLILCTEKDKTLVKYSSILNESNHIFASKYMTYLPTEKELQTEIERERHQIEHEKKLNS